MADFELPPIGEEEQKEETPKFFGEYDTPEAAEQAFKDMKARLDAQSEDARRLQERLDLMMARPEPRAEPRVEPQFPEMPDPVEDPKGYKEAMKRFQETVASDIRAQHERLEQSRLEADRKANAEKLWSDFKAKYAEEGLDDELLAGAIANREAQAIREAGGDPTRYMTANPEGFMERVASGMRAHVSRYRDKPASRTGGIPGGTTSPSGGKAEPRVPTFIEQLKEIRSESEKAFH